MVFVITVMTPVLPASGPDLMNAHDARVTKDHFFPQESVMKVAQMDHIEQDLLFCAHRATLHAYHVLVKVQTNALHVPHPKYLDTVSASLVRPDIFSL